MKIVTLALVVALALVLIPHVSGWFSGLFPGLSFERASEILTQKIEEKGDYVADEFTQEGILRGKISSFVSVEANYTYKAQIGVTLRDVVITPGEKELLVTVPDTRVLSDSFKIEGEPRYNDPLNLRQFGVQFQELVDAQHEACGQEVANNREYMERCWNDTCKQLKDWFIQWTEEELPLNFVHPSKEAAPAETVPAAE